MSFFHYRFLIKTTAVLILGQAVTVTVIAGTEPAAPPAAIAAPHPPSAETAKAYAPSAGKVQARFEMDKQLNLARDAKAKGDWGNAQAAMLDAAQKLRKMGYEHDQVSVLREMTLEPTVGQAPQAQQYVQAGQQAMAEYYYKRYLETKPRDAQWLLEALAWGNVAGDEKLLKRFTARVPDKAHENIDERGRLRGIELKADDALYLAFERIRLDKGEVVSSLQNWAYPIDQKHSLLGTSLLHMAVWYNKPDVVKALVEQHKATVNIEDKEKDTPLDYAYHQQLNDLVAYLKSKSGKTNNTYQKNASLVKPAATPLPMPMNPTPPVAPTRK
jgi:hypothetical protein